MTMHSEFYFEQAIERSLTTDGGYVKGNPKDYDQKNALRINGHCKGAHKEGQ